jgi:hypothetical protein
MVGKVRPFCGGGLQGQTICAATRKANTGALTVETSLIIFKPIMVIAKAGLLVIVKEPGCPKAAENLVISYTPHRSWSGGNKKHEALIHTQYPTLLL